MLHGIHNVAFGHFNKLHHVLERENNILFFDTNKSVNKTVGIFNIFIEIYHDQIQL